MTISFSCPECFKEYRVKEALAGKKVKCKSCEAAMQVPAAESTGFEDDDFLGSLNEAARMESRASAAGLPPKMGGARSSAAESGGSEPVRKKKKKKRRSSDGGGIGKIIVLISLGGLVCLLIVGVLIPSVGLLVSVPVLAIAVISQLIGGLWVWGLAFQEDVLCGLMFFLPLYPLYYLVSRWEDAPPFWLAGYGLLGNIAMQLYLIFLLPNA